MEDGNESNTLEPDVQARWSAFALFLLSFYESPFQRLLTTG